MRSLRVRKSLQDGLSPWCAKEPEDEDEDNQMNTFCRQVLPKLKNQPLEEKINDQFNEISTKPVIFRVPRRPVSNVQPTRDCPSKNIFDRLSQNGHHDMKSAQKPTQPEIRLQLQPLQQINIRNYVIQGTRDCSRDSVIRKKQSSYVMKQKFAQIRRSMNLQLGIWGSVNKNNTSVKNKETNLDKENIVFRNFRYELI